MKKNIYTAVASCLAFAATCFVSVASIAFIYSPDAPEELLK